MEMHYAGLTQTARLANNKGKTNSELKRALTEIDAACNYGLHIPWADTTDDRIAASIFGDNAQRHILSKLCQSFLLESKVTTFPEEKISEKDPEYMLPVQTPSSPPVASPFKLLHLQRRHKNGVTHSGDAKPALSPRVSPVAPCGVSEAAVQTDG